MMPREKSTCRRRYALRKPNRSGFTLLLVMFVLTLVGVTLFTMGGHFTQTARYAQSAWLEAQAAQILHSGLAWAKLHHSDLTVAGHDTPIPLDAGLMGATGEETTASWAWNVEKSAWQMTVRLVKGRHRLVRSVFFHSPSPESKEADSR